MRIFLHKEATHYFVINKGRVFSLYGVDGYAVYAYPETKFDKEKISKTYTELTPEEVEEVKKATAHNIPFFENPPTESN